MAKILVVDDEKKMVALLKSALEHRGHEVVGAFGGQEALAAARATMFDVVLTDLRMEPVDGLQVLDGVKEISPETAVIILTAYAEVQNAVRALQKGAYQYLTKPFNFQEVAHVVEQAAEESDLKRENQALRSVAIATAPLPSKSPPAT